MLRTVKPSKMWKVYHRLDISPYKISGGLHPQDDSSVHDQIKPRNLLNELSMSHISLNVTKGTLIIILKLWLSVCLSVHYGMSVETV